MELLVTVILVSVLASYGVYYYTDIMREGKYNAAKGKLAALGGATARFLLEDVRSLVNQCNYHYVEDVETRYMSKTCGDDSTANGNEGNDAMYDVFRCGYADKNLGITEDYKLSFGCPINHNCGQYSSITVFMKPVAGQDDIVPACAYFDADIDRVIEVRSGE